MVVVFYQDTHNASGSGTTRGHALVASSVQMCGQKGIREGLWYSVDVVVLVVLVKMAVVDLVRIGMPQFDEILLLLVEEERKFGIIEGQWLW